MKLDRLLPIFKRHLSLPYHDRIKGMIAMIFANSDARPYLDFFFSEFRNNNTTSYQTAVANVIIKHVGIKDLPSVIDLIENTKSDARTILLGVLKKYLKKSKLAQEAVRRFSLDPYLSIEIGRWRK